MRSRGARAASPSYSDSAMWKFDPPNPNELTEPRRSWSEFLTQGRVLVFKWNGECSSRSSGFGVSILAVWGSTLWCRAITILNRPAAPAAALV